MGGENAATGFTPQAPQSGMGGMSNLLRRPPAQPFNATATSTSAQTSGAFLGGPPAASMGAPGVLDVTYPQPQVTMSTGVSGAPATFTHLSNINPAVPQDKNAQQAAATATEFNAQSILNELSEGGSTCNSMNIDSGLLNYITDSLDPDQSDSLTKFLNQEIDANSAVVAGNMQQDSLMMPLSNDNLQDIHQQLRDLNQQ